MVNAQQWLDSNYPKEERSKMQELYLNEKALEGELDLADFTGLRYIWISHYVDEGKLKIVNDLVSARIIGLVNAQKWLEKNYPKKEVSEIYINEQLEKELDLSSYYKLEKILISLQVDSSKFEIKKGSYEDLGERGIKETKIIQCVPASYHLRQRYPEAWRKEVIELDISEKNLEGELELTDFSNLERLDCSGNYLTQIIYPTNSEQLTKLDIRNNNLSKQDLTVFSQSRNLEWLGIGNKNKKKISRGIYNRWIGSLEPLRNLNKLKHLDISNTDIDSGLEYLPGSLEHITCSVDQNSKAKVQKINDELFLYGYNSKAWQEAHPELMIKAKRQTIESSCRLLIKVTDTPPSLLSENKIEENCNLEEKINYQGFALRDNRPFSWKFNQSEETLEIWRAKLSYPSEILTDSKVQEWKNQKNFSTANSVKELLEPIKDNSDFSQEIKEKYDINSLEDLMVKKSPQEVITIIKRFEYDRVEKEVRETNMDLVFEFISKEKQETFQKKKINKYYSSENLNEKQINDYLYKEAIGEIDGLPLKLYNIKEDEVELTKDNPNIKSYVILSYVWGQSGTVSDTSITSIWDTKHKDKLNPAGYKTLYKAIQACQNLGIGHLWMDQLCINQDNLEEKSQEVTNMRKYYSNTEVTLIAINAKAKEDNASEKNKKELAIEVLKKIVNSQWFARSWTFQEGWLSKNTIFMFDDILVDGRMLAQVWALLQPKKTTSFSDGESVNANPTSFVTPIGQTYYKYKEDNAWDSSSIDAFTAMTGTSHLGLNKSKGPTEQTQRSSLLLKALFAVKERERSVPIDGIYSILGLLPYGEKVKPNYKPRLCSECGGTEEERLEEEVPCLKCYLSCIIRCCFCSSELTDDPESWNVFHSLCDHGEKSKKWPEYNKNEIEQALVDVMKVSIKEEESNSQVFLWYGPRNDKPWLWWVPQTDKNGSFDIKKVVDIDLSGNFRMSTISLNENGVRSEKSLTYKVAKVINNESEQEFNEFLVETGSSNENFCSSHHPGRVNVFYARGTNEVMKKIKLGDFLVLPGAWDKMWEFYIKNSFKDTELMKRTKFIAILVPGAKDYRIDILELSIKSHGERGHYDHTKNNDVFIDMVKREIIIVDEADSGWNVHQQTRQNKIEIPPKIFSKR